MRNKVENRRPRCRNLIGEGCFKTFFWVFAQFIKWAIMSQQKLTIGLPSTHSKLYPLAVAGHLNLSCLEISEFKMGCRYRTLKKKPNRAVFT